MRVFVGIKASKNLQNIISKWQKQNRNLPVRFIKPKNLHITLVPPWYERKPQTAILKVKAPSLKFKSFEIIFDEIFVNFKNKVIWLESSNPPPKISLLQKNLSLIFPTRKEQRIFKTHLTIARFKDLKLLKDIKFETINWREEVSKITLFKSVLGRKEANYKALLSL